MARHYSDILHSHSHSGRVYFRVEAGRVLAGLGFKFITFRGGSGTSQMGANGGHNSRWRLEVNMQLN